jgi:hypothetical protein
MRVSELCKIYGALTGRDFLDDYDSGLKPHIVYKQLRGRELQLSEDRDA